MEDYLLHARQRKLLYVLNYKHGIATGKELSVQLGVSERTIRTDINEINDVMERYHIQIKSLHGKGYCLQVEDRAAFHQLFFEKENFQTKEDRIKYLILKLIRSDDWCDLGMMEDDMFISRTTLENDLKILKFRIAEHKPYLPLLRKGNYVKLEEDEIKKRNILIRLYCENWDYDSRDGIVLKENAINQKILNQIRIILKEVLKKHSIDLDDFGLIYVILAIAVSYSRILEGHSLTEIEASCAEENITDAVQELLDEMKEVWKLEVNAFEYIWITEILEQLKIQNFKNYTKTEAIEQVYAVCNQLVEKLLEEIKIKYNLDFLKDDIFYKDMLVHVQALMNGIISVQMQSQYFVDELRMQYPFLGDIAHFLCERLESLCDLELGKEEENYLLPLLISAQKHFLENRRGCGISVAVVSHLNYSLTYYFMNRLQEIYGSQLQLKGPFPIYDRDKIDGAHPSLVLTTAQMDAFRRFDVPVITVSPLIEKEEQKKINLHLKKIESDYLYEKMPLPKSEYFHKELFLEIERKSDMKEIIDRIVENLRKNQCIKGDFKIDMEQCYCTALKNGFVFLYVIGETVQNNAVSVASCKHMLTWKHIRNIRNVMLAVLEEQKYLGNFYQMAVEYAENPDIMRR